MPKNIRVIDDDEGGMDIKMEDSEVIVSGQLPVHQQSPASLSTPVSTQPQQTYVTVIPSNASTRSDTLHCLTLGRGVKKKLFFYLFGFESIFIFLKRRYKCWLDLNTKSK